MSGRLGLSGLLRLATLITLAASFLMSGCASRQIEMAHDAVEEKEGWTRCDHAHAPALSVICFQR
jgi:hypothetical protein